MASYQTARTGMKNGEAWGREAWQETKLMIDGEVRLVASNTSLGSFVVFSPGTFLVDTACSLDWCVYFPSDEEQDATDWVKRFPIE